MAAQAGGHPVQMKRKERPPYYWLTDNRLFKTTEMGGFGQIRVSKRRCEVMFWYTLIIAFAFFGAKDLIALIQQWCEGRTVTSMTMTFAKESSLPNSTLCIFTTLPDFNQELDSYGLAAYTQGVEYPWWRQLNESLDAFTTKEQFLTKPWPYVFIPLVNRHLSLLDISSMVEKVFIGSVDYPRKPPSSVDSNFFPPYRFPAGIVTKHFMARLRQLGIDDLELSEKFSTELIRILGIIVELEKRATGYPVNQNLTGFIERVVSVKGNEFCFDIAVPPGHTFRTLQSSVRLLADLTSLEPFFYEPSLFNESLIDENKKIARVALKESKMQWFLNDHANYEPTSGPVDIEVKLPEPMLGTIRVDAKYEHIRGCSPDTSYAYCRAACRVRLLEGICNCAPFNLKAFGVNTSTSAVCDTDDYLSCLKYRVEHDLECRHGCEPLCRRTLYRVSNLERVPEYVFGRNTIGLQAFFTLTSYTTFIEEEASSWQNFLGDIGGVLDFWLGASLFSVVHLVLFLVKQLGHTTFGDEDTAPKRNIQLMVSDVRSLAPSAKKTADLEASLPPAESTAVSRKWTAPPSSSSSDESVEQVPAESHRLKKLKKKHVVENGETSITDETRIKVVEINHFLLEADVKRMENRLLQLEGKLYRSGL